MKAKQRIRPLPKSLARKQKETLNEDDAYRTNDNLPEIKTNDKFARIRRSISQEKLVGNLTRRDRHQISQEHIINTIEKLKHIDVQNLSFKTPKRRISPKKLDPIHLILSPKASIQLFDLDIDFGSD